MTKEARDAFATAVPFEQVVGDAEARGLLLAPIAPEVFEQRIEQARASGLLRVPDAPFDADVFSLAQYQTGFKRQWNRGTCYAFAGVAALEAFLNRRDGVARDLSEHYLFHMHQVTYLDPLAAAPPVETGHSLVDFRGNSAILEDMIRFALPSESDVPYLDKAQLRAVRDAIPEAARGSLAGDDFATQEALDAFEYSEGNVPLAGRLRASYAVTEYATLPSVQPDVLEQTLRAGHEIVVDVPGHCMLLIGYDRPNRTWLFKNSWGENTWVTRSYDNSGIGSGTYIVDASPPQSAPQLHPCWVGRWNMDHDGWRGTLVIRRFTNRRDGPGHAYYDLDGKPTKLGDYYGAAGRREVHGYFRNHGRTMVFHLAPDEVRRPPGTLEGQEFEAHILTEDLVNAAGQTTWNGTPYGLFLTRGELPSAKSVPFQPADWLGRWAFNHNGRRGVLEILNVGPDGVKATYAAAGGEADPIYARLDELAAHMLHARLDSPKQDQWFALYHHTREAGVLSGVAAWAGEAWGVQGIKVPG